MHIDAEPEVTTTELTERECWEYLAQHDFGRIAVNVRGTPSVFPVGYSVVPGGILVRTRPGSKLLAILLDSRIAFEVDERTDLDGWSVLVTGEAEEVDPGSNEWHTMPAAPFAGADAHVLLLLTPTQLTGRLLHRG
jgi:nitroimidazol reductase NimA-like FMN-containing flavoprotein (pyridoxamine 5'-phosphate oxidase superfamily)